MVPGYKQPDLATDPRPMSNLRWLISGHPIFCDCRLVQPYRHPPCLNISKVSVTVISKHQNTVCFSNFRMTLPSESSKRQQRVFGIVFLFNVEAVVVLRCHESHIFGHFWNLWTKHLQPLMEVQMYGVERGVSYTQWGGIRFRPEQLYLWRRGLGPWL